MQDARAQLLFFDDIALRSLRADAQRLDQSVSSVAQRSWQLARTDIQRLSWRDDALNLWEPDGPRRKETLSFPNEMLAEMKQESARLDCSLSLLVTIALSLARDEGAAVRDPDR
jgi:uncharacterized small protein (TIGR04563 family)